MAQTSQSTSSRRRPTTGKSNGSTRSRTNGSKRATKRSGGATKRSGRAAKRSSTSVTSQASRQSNSASRNSSGDGVVKTSVMPVVTAVVGAAAGVAGGVLIGRNNKPRRKLLGVPIPGSGAGGFDGLASQVGEAAKQFSRLAGEVRQTRERAEKVGKALS